MKWIKDLQIVASIKYIISEETVDLGNYDSHCDVSRSYVGDLICLFKTEFLTVMVYVNYEGRPESKDTKAITLFKNIY